MTCEFDCEVLLGLTTNVILYDSVCILLFTRIILQEHVPEIWWKTKKKLRARLSLKLRRKLNYWKQCRRIPLTNGNEKSFPCYPEEN